MSAPSSGPLVNVGCGLARPAGWVNIDGSAQAWFAAHPALARSDCFVSWLFSELGFGIAFAIKRY